MCDIIILYTDEILSIKIFLLTEKLRIVTRRLSLEANEWDTTLLHNLFKIAVIFPGVIIYSLMKRDVYLNYRQDGRD